MQPRRAPFITLFALLLCSTVIGSLYNQPYAKDQVSTQLDLVSRLKTVTVASADVDLLDIYTVPNDRVFLLQSASLRMHTGTPDTPGYIRLYATIGGIEVEISSCQAGPQDITNLRMSCNWSGEIYLPQGAIINAYGGIQTGGDENELLWGSIFGVSIPRGNFSLGG